MKREILLRGKRMDNGEWVEGSLIVLDWESDQVYIMPEVSTCSTMSKVLLIAWNMVLVDKKTICQYTGFTDKNDRKIFEGDIICNHYDDEYPEDETFCVVVWNKTSWVIRENGSTDLFELDEHDTEDGEVVENIFDTPELIEADSRPYHPKEEN